MTKGFRRWDHVWVWWYFFVIVTVAFPRHYSYTRAWHIYLFFVHASTGWLFLFNSAGNGCHVRVVAIALRWIFIKAPRSGPRFHALFLSSSLSHSRGRASSGWALENVELNYTFFLPLGLKLQPCSIIFFAARSTDTANTSRTLGFFFLLFF